MGYNYGNYYGAMMADTAGGGGAGEYPGALQPNGQGMGGCNTLEWASGTLGEDVFRKLEKLVLLGLMTF